MTENLTNISSQFLSHLFDGLIDPEEIDQVLEANKYITSIPPETDSEWSIASAYYMEKLHAALATNASFGWSFVDSLDTILERIEEEVEGPQIQKVLYPSSNENRDLVTSLVYLLEYILPAMSLGQLPFGSTQDDAWYWDTDGTTARVVLNAGLCDSSVMKISIYPERRGVTLKMGDTYNQSARDLLWIQVSYTENEDLVSRYNTHFIPTAVTFYNNADVWIGTNANSNKVVVSASELQASLGDVIAINNLSSTVLNSSINGVASFSEMASVVEPVVKSSSAASQLYAAVTSCGAAMKHPTDVAMGIAQYMRSSIDALEKNASRGGVILYDQPAYISSIAGFVGGMVLDVFTTVIPTVLAFIKPAVAGVVSALGTLVTSVFGALNNVSDGTQWRKRDDSASSGLSIWNWPILTGYYPDNKLGMLPGSATDEDILNTYDSESDSGIVLRDGPIVGYFTPSTDPSGLQSTAAQYFLSARRLHGDSFAQHFNLDYNEEGLLPTDVSMSLRFDEEAEYFYKDDVFTWPRVGVTVTEPLIPGVDSDEAAENAAVLELSAFHYRMAQCYFAGKQASALANTTWNFKWTSLTSWFESLREALETTYDRGKQHMFFAFGTYFWYAINKNKNAADPMSSLISFLQLASEFGLDSFDVLHCPDCTYFDRGFGAPPQAAYPTTRNRYDLELVADGTLIRDPDYILPNIARSTVILTAVASAAIAITSAVVSRKVKRKMQAKSAVKLAKAQSTARNATANLLANPSDPKVAKAWHRSQAKYARAQKRASFWGLSMQGQDIVKSALYTPANVESKERLNKVPESAAPAGSDVNSISSVIKLIAGLSPLENA